MSDAPASTERAQALQRLRDHPDVPVLIIGGGINGAATFRDLCLQGIDCLIVDKGDWCSGTSAAPSRLIHGGLKYLETGEFRLVAESARERNLLLRNAPHLVKALPTVLPIKSYFSGIIPSVRRFFGLKARLADRGLLMVELGLALYDWLGRKHRVMPRHHLQLRNAVHRRFPAMAASVVAASTYYDARITQAERLCFELVADGLAANPQSLALNYMAVSGADAGRISLCDQNRGEVLTIDPHVVVNAAGPWIDRVNQSAGINKAYIGGTKGSHLVLDNAELVRQLDGHMVYFGSSDGRICLAYPFYGHALIGSTDIPAADPDAAVCSDAEAEYMLRMVGEIFPSLHLALDQIVYRYSGIRPLPQAEVDNPGEISRDHSIGRDRLPGRDRLAGGDRLAGSGIPILSLVGGKWTTFRAFAAEAADMVLGLLGRARLTGTEQLAIGGGRDFPASVAARAHWIEHAAATHGISATRAAVLLDRYGTRAQLLLASFPHGADVPLASLPDYSAAEIGAVIRAEQVVQLADLAFRRLPIAVSGRLDRTVLDELAAIAAATLDWTDADRGRQVRDVLDIAGRRHGMQLQGNPHR